MDDDGARKPLRFPRPFYTKLLAEDVQEREYESHLMSVSIPEFEPVSRARVRKEGQASQTRDWMSVFLYGADSPFEGQLRYLLQTPGLSLDDPKRLRELRNPPDYRQFPQRPGPYGLTQVFGPNTRGDMDLFVYSPVRNAVESYISCTNGYWNGELFRLCALGTRIDEINVTIIFREFELSNWRGMWRNVERFLSCAAAAD